MSSRPSSVQRASSPSTSGHPTRLPAALGLRRSQVRALVEVQSYISWVTSLMVLVSKWVCPKSTSQIPNLIMMNPQRSTVEHISVQKPSWAYILPQQVVSAVVTRGGLIPLQITEHVDTDLKHLTLSHDTLPLLGHDRPQAWPCGSPRPMSVSPKDANATVSSTRSGDSFRACT